MTPVEVIEAAQYLWNQAHKVGTDKIDNTAGDYYLLVQQSGGNLVFESTKNSYTDEDSLDEIIVGVVGDTIQAAALIAFPPLRVRR